MNESEAVGLCIAITRHIAACDGLGFPELRKVGLESDGEYNCPLCNIYRGKADRIFCMRSDVDCPGRALCLKTFAHSTSRADWVRALNNAKRNVKVK